MPPHSVNVANKKSFDCIEMPLSGGPAAGDARSAAQRRLRMGREQRKLATSPSPIRRIANSFLFVRELRIRSSRTRDKYKKPRAIPGRCRTILCLRIQRPSQTRIQRINRYTHRRKCVNSNVYRSKWAANSYHIFRFHLDKTGAGCNADARVGGDEHRDQHQFEQFE